MNRRLFLRNASLPLLGASSLPALLGGCTNLGQRYEFGAPAPQRPGIVSSRRNGSGTQARPLPEPIDASPGASAALHVLNRLGYGPRPGDLRDVLALGVDRYIEQQLNPEGLALPAALEEELNRLPTASLSVGELMRGFASAQRAALAQQAVGGDPQPARSFIAQAGSDAARARLLRAIDSPRQLEELMTDFWFNHFNVFIGKNLDRVLVGHYERHAIRPHVFGRFRDLLGATAKHPAMLFYLDNALSVAPGFTPRRAAANAQNAQNAQNAPTGLNENYARELMELHTLGADAGYAQRDVTELARMLTGWTFDRNDTTGDAFRFAPPRHDTGEKQWLGHRVLPAGVAEGEFALDVLAAHPATARRIAFKLAQFFVADEPPAELVSLLSQRFTASGGQIREVLHALFAAPEFRDASNDRRKFKTPLQFVVSAVRAADLSLPSNVAPLTGTLAQLGMPLYGCATPDGYANTERAWLNPEAMMRRVGFATALASGRLALYREDAPAVPPTARAENATRGSESPRTPPMAPLDWRVVQSAIGPAFGERTRATIEQAAPAMRSSLALGSPEFMRK